MKTIEISERMMDYWIDASGVHRPKFHAQIKGEPGLWACGRTPDHAIGDLVRSHPEHFGIKIKNIGKQAR
jgi:hypothetical protein